MAKVKFLKSFISGYFRSLELHRNRIVLGVVLLGITGYFVANLPRLSFDYQFDRLFPKNDPETIAFRKHIKQFDRDSEFMYLIVSDEESIFRKELIEKVRSLEQKLEADSAIKSVISPASLQKWKRTVFGSIPTPLLGNNTGQLKSDSAFIFSHPFYREFFSSDKKSLLIYTLHERSNDGEKTQKLLESITDDAQEIGLNLMIVGPAKAQQEFVAFIQNDFTKFLIGSVALSFALLLFLFRDLRSVFLPFIISIMSTVWLFGFIAALGYKINLLSALLPPIIFFVAISDVIHLMNSFKKADAQSKNEKIIEAIKVAWQPTLLTSITTAIGFLSLLWINTEPIQQLGLFAAAGVVFAFVITYSIGLLYMHEIPVKSYTRIHIPDQYPSILKKKSVPISVIIIAFILISIPGIFKITTDAYILDDLPETAPVRRELAYANDQLGGVKTLELRVELINKNLSFESPEVLAQLKSIHDFLKDSMEVQRIQSPISAIQLAHSSIVGSSSAFVYPSTEKELNAALKRIKSFKDDKQSNPLISRDSLVVTISGFIPDQGTVVSIQNYERIKEFIGANADPEIIQVIPTGATYLIDKTNDHLSINLLKGLASAVVVIAIFLGLYFRSWKLLLISLIPNIIPLVVIAGIIGWLGISLKMTSAIIFTVAFGIAVDDTIHFMSYYVQNLNSPHPMKKTFNHAGSAMLITTIIMTAGFALFMLSDFGATFFMGFFVSAALLIALVIDFTILPLLLDRFLKGRKS